MHSRPVCAQFSRRAPAVLLLLAALLRTVAVSAPPPAASPTVSNVTADNISHSDSLVHFDVANGPWNWLRLRWTTSPGGCESGRGGTVVATSYNGQAGFVQSQPRMWLILSGLPPASTIHVCPELSRDNHNWSRGAGGLFQTLPLPAVHPALPLLPRAAAPVYPDTRGFAIWTVGETTAPDCSTLHSCFNSAIEMQSKHGTVIQIRPGQPVVGRTWADKAPPDVKDFPASAIDLAHQVIRYSGHGYREGQALVFGTVYSSLPGHPQTPGACDGLNYGIRYYVHKPTAETFGLTCDKPALDGGAPLVFRDAGSGNVLRMAAYPRALYPIVIRTATPDAELPPPGTRIGPQWSPKLAHLEADAALTIAPYTGNGFHHQMLSTTVFHFGNMDNNAHTLTANVWLVGLDISPANTARPGDNDPEPGAALLDLPLSSSDNVVDRCYIHGRGYPNRVATAIWWNGRNNAFTGNYFDHLDYWHPVHGCQSVPSRHVSEGTNAMIGGEGPGPYVFVNNYVEGAGNLWHHDGGGAIFHPQNDYLYVRNTFRTPPKYRFGSPQSDGYSYYNRQPLEWKGGHRILLDGNRFLDNFHHIAVSTVVLTSVGVNGQPGYGISDITLTNNTFRHLPAVMTLLSTQGGQFQTPPIDRVLVRNNLMDDINGSYFAPLDGTNACDSACHCRPWTGWIFQGFGDGEDRIVDHNTITHIDGIAPAIIRFDGSATEGLALTNNVLDEHDAAFSQEGDVNDAGGQATCRDKSGGKMLSCLSPGMRIANNHRMALDGAGVDLQQLERAQGGVKLSAVTNIHATSAQVNFTAPDAQACPVDVGAEDPALVTKFTRITDTGKQLDRTVTLTGLKAQTKYYFRVNCAVEQPMGSFKTSP